jgi:thioredoxin-related protein
MFTVAASCSSSKKTESNQKDAYTESNDTLPVETILPDTFILPIIPEIITDNDARAIYLVKHYWDRFDFNSISLIDRPEITEQAFVDYINILNYVSKDVADASLRETINKAETDYLMHLHFRNLFEKYFFDPNSPFRNEEYYIPILKEVIDSEVMSDTEKSVYNFQYEMLMKNRVGEKGNNFNYTLASGQTLSLYNLKSEYTLLMFSNPGCQTCEAVTQQLNISDAINNVLDLNSSTRTMLTIISLYTDENIDLWLGHLPKMPQNWIHGYDKGMTITQKKLYDIRAIPTLYLFDKEKNVVLKDTSIEAIENFFTTPY